MKRLVICFLGLALLLVFMANCWAGVVPAEKKWLQKPDMIAGKNIKSMNPEPIVADDWLCLDGRPVIDVHFWGSFIGWEEQYPQQPPSRPPEIKAFVIRIYEDLPIGGPDEFSRPGRLLYEVNVEDFYWEYYGTIPRPDGTYEHKFFYTLNLPRPFWQKQDDVYWLSVSAIMDDITLFPWGWETSCEHWRDFAVQGYTDLSGAWVWEELKNMDMAFALTTCYSDAKWWQPPDIEAGVNIKSTEPEPIVADDWKCKEGKPVSDIHFWGSYIRWEEENPEPKKCPPGVDGFKIRIFENIPAGQNGFSHPGKLLYEAYIDDFIEEYFCSIPRPTIPETYEHKFHYTIYLKEPFKQIEGEIYWLSISAVKLVSPNIYPWGWETCNPDYHWEDYAVQGYQVGPDDAWRWEELPRKDMAFILTIPYEDPCEGDLDLDGDVDIDDLERFAYAYGSIKGEDPNYDPACDFYPDLDVDGSDLAIFAADYGKERCPCPSPSVWPE